MPPIENPTSGDGRHALAIGLILSIVMPVLVLFILRASHPPQQSRASSGESAHRNPSTPFGSQVPTMTAPALATSPAVPATRERPAAETNVIATNPKVEAVTDPVVAEIQRQKAAEKKSPQARLPAGPVHRTDSSHTPLEHPTRERLLLRQQRWAKDYFGPLVGIGVGPKGRFANFERMNRLVYDGEVICGVTVHVLRDKVTFTKDGLEWTYSEPKGRH
jgi:hypothetical protein